MQGLVIVSLLPILAIVTTLAAPRAGMGTLFVTVRPAAAIVLSGTTAYMQIRLHDRTQALVWREGACGEPPMDAYRIEASGTFAVVGTSIPGQGGKICLRSTDGSLAKQWTLP